MPISCSRSQSPLRPGFSLAEVVASLGLMALNLMVVATLLRGYSSAMRTLPAEDRLIDAATSVLGRIQAETLNSFEILSPAPGTQGAVSDLKFKLVDPQQVDRLPQTLEIGPGTSWEPLAGNLTVNYSCDGRENLVRSLGDLHQEVLDQVTGFSALVMANGNLRLSLAVRNQSKVVSIRSEVYFHFR